jgi:hypothetical protein
MSNSSIRFGIWALVHGSRAALQDPDEPYDASWERNRSLVLKAEALGYDSTLVAQHTINPHRWLQWNTSIRTRSSTRGLTNSIKPPDMIRTLETLY